MSFCGLSDLHIVPRGKTVTSVFYVEEVLKGKAASALRWRTEKWPPTAVKLLPDKSQATFQDETEPPLTPPPRSRRWCQANYPAFWAKGSWPDNCTDLSPIENLWAIIQDKLDKTDPATSEATLIENVRSVWRSISAETLDNLMCGMPQRKRSTNYKVFMLGQGVWYPP